MPPFDVADFLLAAIVWLACHPMVELAWGVVLGVVVLLKVHQWRTGQRREADEAAHLAAIATLHADMDRRRPERVFRAVKGGRA